MPESTSGAGMSHPLSSAVMGIQHVRDVTLIRHAYVRTAHQAAESVVRCSRFFADQATGRLLVGTWAAAEWAIRLYEQHGFRLVSLAEKDRLLSTYWSIPSRQKEASVVLMYTR